MIKNELLSILNNAAKKSGIDSPVIALEHPGNSANGDYSCNVGLRYAKQLKRNPFELAQTVAANIPPSDLIDHVEVVKPGFLNIWLSKKVLVENISTILNEQGNYGKNQQYQNKKVIVEYSSPNIAKPFTIGHLRSTIIGDAVANLLEAVGYEVFRDNHIGDWGTQFGKQIYAIKTWGSIEEIEKSDRPVKLLVNLYVKFHEEAEKDSKLEEEGRKWFKKLEEGDKEARELWQKCIEWSWKEFDSIYKLLNVTFTENNGKGYGESYFENKMQLVIKEIEAKKLLQESKNAKLVFFPADKYPPLMIIKEDGATLYSTRDLATDKFRLTNPRYGSEVMIINEVGAEQTLYFQQLIEIETMLGWIKEGQRLHIKHGMYRFKDQKMSTRKGNVIWLENVLEEAINRAKKLSLEQNTTIPDVNIDNIKKIAVGAIKWNDLKRSPAQDIVFDWDDILNMQGDSGPYMQYTYVRCQSVLRKAGDFKNVNSNDLNADENNLLRALVKYPDSIIEAANQKAPNIISNYLFDLSQKFNLFYQKQPILKAEGDQKNFRLMLTQAVGQTIKNGLYLLGIDTVEKM